MGRINSGINATSGGAPLGSAVYFVVGTCFTAIAISQFTFHF